MKKKYITIISVFLLGFYSCKPDCSQVNSEACLDTDTTLFGGVGNRYFESWFYDGGTKTCETKGYQGDFEIGFKTEKECLECDCN